MARIRTIKPDAFKSETLSRIPRGARWTFAGLWTYVDDAGRGVYNPRLIWAELYPLDDSTTVRDVEDDIAHLESVGAVVKYVADGRDYIAVPAFDKHQAAAYRRTDSHLPAPSDADLHDSSRSSMKESAQSYELRAGREGKGREREGNSCASADAERDADHLADDFAEWYETFPRKRGKGQALKAYRAARKKADADLLLDALRRQIPALMAKGPEFCPYPATWLNGERWADEPDNVRPIRPETDEHGRLLLPPLPKGVFEQ